MSTKKTQKAYIFKGTTSRLLNNTRGSSFWFIYTLAFAFVLAILYIIFGQILHVYIYPTTQFLTNGDTTAPDLWLTYWGWVPFMIVLIIAAFMFFRLTNTPSGE